MKWCKYGLRERPSCASLSDRQTKQGAHDDRPDYGTDGVPWQYGSGARRGVPAGGPATADPDGGGAGGGQADRGRPLRAHTRAEDIPQRPPGPGMGDAGGRDPPSRGDDAGYQFPPCLTTATPAPRGGLAGSDTA